MRSAYARWLLVAALATAVGAVATGCGNDQETINRVQPNALRKSVLDGEWYYLQTVVDTPATTTYTFVGEQGSLKKIRWEIQEDYLIARRVYDYVAGAEQDDVGADNDAKNTALAMYRITSHFDVRREYNPATGEQTNVISENTVDRPWYDREFMRVDWSENLVTDGNFMMFARIFDGIQVESAYYKQLGADAPKFETDENGEVNYVDIVNKMFVKPTEVDIPGFGKVPTCLLNGSVDICEPAEISVRNSFLKVKDRDYQPMLYTGDRMERFGFFVDERMGYSEDYGNVESERYRFVQRHNIWQQSHRRNDEGKLIGCTSDDQCSRVKGSTCDLDWGRAHRRYTDKGEPQGLCTIPYRDREIRPVVYYASPNLPKDLAGDLDTLAKEWNKAFTETVASLRENECLEVGDKDCAEERTKVKKIFHICKTPVEKGAPKVCGQEGFAPNPGDLRYHQVVWVASEQAGGPLGYGPGHSDPETGETIMGNAFLYGAGMERLATYGRDIVALLNGDLTVAGVQEGDYITEWAKAARVRAEKAAQADATELREQAEAAQHTLGEGMDYSWIHTDFVKQVPRNIKELKEAVETAKKGLYNAGAFGRGVDQGAARLSRLRGTDIEAMMVTPEMRLAAGLNPFDTNLGNDVLEAASPLRGRSLDTIRAIERARQIIREKVGFYDGEFADEGMVGLAMEIQEAASKNRKITWYGKEYEVSNGKGKIDYDAVRTMIRHPMFHGLTLHEIGHSIGLRHNFSGSYDALNYHPEYWKIRLEGDNAPKPRYWDPETPNERKKRIREYQYSTVMDYGHNFIVSDAAGIGHYDRAAIKMGYGDLIEVFAEVPEPARVAGISVIQGLGLPIMIDLFAKDGLKAFNYTDWPKLVGGRANLEKRVDVPYTQLRPVPVLAFEGFDDHVADAKGRAVVPYLFCSDEQGDLNPDCMRYDSGADPYESVQSIIDSYWYYYPFISFRRQRLGFDVGPTVDRIHNRYFEKLKRAHQIYALYRPIFMDVFDIAADDPFWTDRNGMGAWTAASEAGFDLLRKVITAPEPGAYGKTLMADGTEVFSSVTRGGEISVDALDGRYLETSWDFDAGYFWFDQLDRVGYFYDKAFALLTIVDPTTYFVGRDTDADIRRYQINYANSFGPAVAELFRSILSEDWTAVAPRPGLDGKVIYPRTEQIAKRNMEGVPISPNVSFSIQLYASVFGMAYLPQTYDQSFIQSSRVWVEGGAEEIVLDPSVPVVKFTNPESGLTYVAISYTNADGEETGVGASMLRHVTEMFETAAGKDGVFGTSDDDPVARTAARKYIDNIDLVRRLSWELGFGAQP